MNYKVSEENAKKQLDILIDYYEIEIDNEILEDSFDIIKSRLIKAIQKGSLEITNEGGLKIKQVLKNGDFLEYKELTGEAKLEMDKYEKNGAHAKMYGLAGFLTGKGHAVISKLPAADLKVTEALLPLFLAA